jgi:exodeoxyribonuclease VII large subunit
LGVLEKLKLDLVAIVRGGGSKTDLFYLDNEVIARKIAAYRYPVWTGIGHEIDTGILDYVANKSFKTPTAVAEEIVARFKEMAMHLEDAENRFRSTWSYRLENEKRYLLDATVGIRKGTRKLLDHSKTELSNKANQLSSRVVDRLSKENAKMAVSKKILSSTPMVIIKNSKILSKEWSVSY